MLVDVGSSNWGVLTDAPPAPSLVHEPLNMWQSLGIFRHPYFLLIFAVYLVVFSSGLSVLTQAEVGWLACAIGALN